MPAENITIDRIIEVLHLQPLSGEGGLYCQTYVSSELIPPSALPARFVKQPKPFGSAIYYLLTGEEDSFSALHRLHSDEIYHFYLGDPLEMTLLFPDGSARKVVLGQDILKGEQLQVTAPAGAWQGSKVRPGGRFSLVGTTMAPAYSHDDFELGKRDALLAAYPSERDAILALTRE